ncbi:Chromatin structure-remodeling complex protein BSH [Acorus calamus]|uniref:Chromatin structure-remodeling complex protein BSH n=1 Tax=Acorus calamus TaxID=4465 RepID=A0AAV9D2K1_ACOCL|nr:Chromatin structure-remodeling complex protein BSH [Acorus calamus]
MKSLPPNAYKQPVRFRMPTAENLIPMRLDIDVDGQRFKDSFLWNPNDPDSEMVFFAKRTVKDLGLPPGFVTQIAQSIQSQLMEFRALEGQEMYASERIVPIKLDLRVNKTVIRDQFLWDLSNFDSDPEEFARNFCSDLEIQDPEVGPAIAIAIREQLYEIVSQSVSSARETRVGKKGRRVAEYITPSRAANNAMDLTKLFGNKASVIRKRKEWDLYEPLVDILSNEEAEALDAKEERNARKYY